jgi:CubicO group peptidase (beta-lactamase class C family)
MHRFLRGPSLRVVGLAFALAGALALPARAQDAAPLPTTDELTQLLSAFDVPGLAMATLTGCEVDTVLVAGKATLEPAVPVSPATAFEAASLSKPVFAYLVLSLAEEGLLDLDRPLAPGFDYARIPDTAAYAKLTPRMILTHRTGLPNWVGEEVDFYDRTTSIPFEAPPGTAYSYSGEAFQLLQAFVETATGQSLQQLFRERLGAVMPHSTFARPLPGGVVPSRGYRSASDPATGRAMTNLQDRGLAAASLVTTAGDYANFLSHVCHCQGLRPETYADMLAPQSPVPENEAAVPTSYGLGWMLADVGEGTFAGHGGNNDEYRALAGFVIESGDGLVVLTNGAGGESLIDVLLTPAQAAPDPSGPDPSLSLPEATFEEFWAIYNEGYALFGVKHVDWDAIHTVYRPRVGPETTDDELWALLEEVIDLLNDVHVTLTDPATGRQARSGGRSIGVGPFENGEFDLHLVEQAYASGGLASAADGRLRHGWLPGEIGYLHIRAFEDLEASTRAIDAVVEGFEGAKGLVVDVRHNGGGDDRVGRALAGRFTAAPRLYMTVATRKFGQVPPAFAAPVEWWVRPAGPAQYTGPIVLLVNSRTISAAENVALAFRAVPHALIMGETTAGVMADTAPQPLPNGWRVTVPINLFRDASGMSWEGIGIPPDLWVKNDRTDVAAGRDRVLETALDFLSAGAVRPRDRAAPRLGPRIQSEHAHPVGARRLPGAAKR